MEIILFSAGLSIGTLFSILLYLNKISALKNNIARLKEIEKINLQSRDKIRILEGQNNQLLILQGRFEQAQVTILDLKKQLENYRYDLEIQNNKIISFEKQNELLRQSQKNLEDEKQEWQAQKERILFELSEKLIKKNNQDRDKFGKDQEEKIGKITQDLFKSFENILNKVSSLDDDVKKSNNEITLTKNALLNPNIVGKATEITLENILKSSGLKEKLNDQDDGDFILQSHFLSSDNSLKKPDAILDAPNNHKIIIDSKSSIYFLDLQKARDQKDAVAELQIKAKIKDAMKKHLDDLKKRDYANAKEFDSLKQDNRDIRFTTVMFLQTERMLEVIREIDSKFETKALEAGIWVLTPIGLCNLLSQTKFIISRIKQEKNVEILRIEVKKLLDSVATMFNRSKEIGKSVNKAMRSYNDFATTFNKGFISKVRNLNKMGIEGSKGPINDGDRLEKYNIVSDNDIIELEAG